MKKYNQYKNSGVEWLGEIPEHWEVKRFKHISSIQKGKLPKKIVSSNDVNLPPYMSMEYLRGGEENQWVFDKDAKIIDENKTLLLWDGSNAGEFIKSRKGVISSTVAQIEFKYIHNNFAWYYSKFLEIELRKKTIGMGIPHVNGTELKNFSVAIPPLEEQTAIANFLDDKTTKIEQAIAIKQKQIELLKERRQILIHKAVTRGLNDNVKLKDSNVEWIGEIPEHWEVRRFKFLCHITTGSKNTEDKVENGKYPFYVRSQKPERINSYTFDGEAILTAGDGAGVGKVFHYLNEKFDFHQRVYKFSNFKHIKGKLLYYYIKNNFHNVALNGEAKSTVDSLRLPLIQNFLVTLPPIEEQMEIINRIETTNKKIATAISLKEQEIDKLKEYKMSLIDGVVTGKVKVC
jgi:type I restriction enzyme S subunit